MTNTGTMTTAKVVDVKRNDDNQPVVIYFEVADDLEIGDLVTVTIVRSEE